MKFDFEGVNVNYITLNFEKDFFKSNATQEISLENNFIQESSLENKENVSNENEIHKTPILFLHGWGGSTDSFLFCAKALRDKPCILLDFPPFGKSDEPLSPWNIEDYARLVTKLLRFLKINKVDIVAHSFGGRVAIELASTTQMVRNLLLTGSAGLTRKSFKVHFKESLYKMQKFLAKIKLYPKAKLLGKGSDDYKNLTEVMKKTFVQVVNYDQTKLLSKINVPTLLVWGKLDKETPFYFTKIFKKHIKDCEVISFEGLGHFAYLQKPNTFIQIIKNFFKDF